MGVEAESMHLAEVTAVQVVLEAQQVAQLGQAEDDGWNLKVVEISFLHKINTQREESLYLSEI